MAGRKQQNDEENRPNAVDAANEAAGQGHITGDQPKVTTVEGSEPGDLSGPDTAPGDAPFDTTDPRERISTVIPSGAEAAEAARSGMPMVAYVKVGEVGQEERDESEDRTEEYEVQGVRIRHNLETGESVRL
jgi:hypothetical protein